MALPPATEDAFVREVDDELRRDQLTGAWQRYGRLAIILLVVALIALAGFLYWQHRREQQAGVRAEALTGALADLGEGKEGPASTALAKLADGGDPAYASAAKLTQAGIALAKGDAKAAAQTFDAVANDGAVPKPLRDLALIRGTAAAFDTLPPQQVIDRMKPLAVPGGPWFGSAAEMTAIAYLKLNQPKRAGELFGQIVKDKNVPETLRGRAVRIAGMLGVDAVDAVEKTEG